MGQIQPVDILIVTALPEELDALVDLFDLTQKPAGGSSANRYYINNIFPSRSSDKTYTIAAICLPKMGNTSSALHVTSALHDLNPASVIMFGLAGGFKKEAKLSDVIISDRIFCTALRKQYPNHRDLRLEPITIDPNLLQELRTYKRLLQNQKNYTIKIGPFVADETVNASAHHTEEFLKIHPKMLGMDMESYGVGEAVRNYDRNINFVSIRGVSDYGEEDKNDEYRTAALKNAADFLIEFIKSGSLPKRQKPSGQPFKFVSIHHISLYRQTSILQVMQSYLEARQPVRLHEIVVDLTDLFKDGSLTDPKEALVRQQTILLRNRNKDVQSMDAKKTI